MIKVRQVTLGKNRFNYRTCGYGPDVLLLHGWISSGRMWEALMCEIAPGCRVWAPDLMGFGESSNGEPMRVLTLADQTGLIAEFCEALGLRLKAIIGHSMGGSIALKLALDHAVCAEKLILICPVITGRLGLNVDQLLGNPIGQTLFNFGQFVWPHILQFPHIAQMVAPSYLDPGAIRRTLEEVQKATWGASYGAVMSMINVRLDRRLKDIKQPTLLISGEHDTTISPDDARLVENLMPDVKHVRLPNCHHQPPDEAPDYFHKAVKDFLRIGTKRTTHAA